jgi:mannose-6-phosphate isomerase-like protein (cupin superfamily)
MRAIGISLVLAMMAAAVVAQQSATQSPDQMMKTFVSSADVTALIAKAKTERKEGQGVLSQRMLQLAPYNVNLEYRASVAAAAVHEKEAEVFYVVDGGATMVTGGKLVNETRPNADNLSGTAIEGGTPRTIAKGDFVIVPENTPHWFSAINGVLVVMSFHVPRPLPAAH